MTNRFASLRNGGPFIVLLLLVAAISLGAAPTASAVDVTFSCDAAACLFPDTDTLAVSVNIDAGTTDLRGASISVLFNSAAVMPVAVEAGPLWGDSGCMATPFWNNPGSPDSVSVDIAGLGCSAVGPGSILVIKFVCVSPAVSSVLSCGTCQFRDVTNAHLPYTCTPITVQCEYPTPAEAASWGVIKTRYRD